MDYFSYNANKAWPPAGMRKADGTPIGKAETVRRRMEGYKPPSPWIRKGSPLHREPRSEHVANVMLARDILYRRNEARRMNRGARHEPRYLLP
jgi:hypothetical protein